MQYLKNLSLSIATLLIAMAGMAQMPTNDDKKFEYKKAMTVKRASTGDLHARFSVWGEGYFKDAQVEWDVDDTNYRYVTMNVTENMIESHFGVNRSHKDRKLSYTLMFDTDKKNYTYTLNNIRYSCVEVDRKGVEMEMGGPFEDFKSPASRSVEEEIHNNLTTVIESFKKAAEKELPDDVMDAIEAERDRKEDERDAAEEAREKAAEAAEKAAKEAAAAAEAAEKAKAEEEAKAAEAAKAAEEAEESQPEEQAQPE